MATITRFNGLNNVSDPLRLGLAWLTQADNIDITSTGAIKKRTGYTKTFTATGAITGAYSTDDFTRLYVVDAGSLKVMTSPSASITLRTGLNAAPMHWTEANDQVFFSSGVDSGIILPDNSILPWRESELRDTEFLDAAGNPLPSLLHPLPLGVGVIQHWRGRIYCAQYFPDLKQSAVWFSKPLGWHLFNLDTDYILLPGHVTMLAPHDQALIIGTDSAIHSHDGVGLTSLAPYGVVPGRNWVRDGARTLFWSARGLCEALPFANLTDRQVSVAPGLQAGGTLIEQGGSRRYVAVLQAGGQAFNPL